MAVSFRPDGASGAKTPAPKPVSPTFSTPPKFVSPKFSTPPKFTVPPRFTVPAPNFSPNFTSVARQIKDAGATAGEAQRFANEKSNQTAPPAEKPTTPTFTRPVTPSFTAPPRFTAPTPPPARIAPPPQQQPEVSVVTPEPPTISPEPNLPTPPAPVASIQPKIKVAPIDTVLFDDDQVPGEIIADLLFENIGGQEILTLARHDTVNGQTILYQPIKNINILQQQYSPDNLLKLRNTSKTIFANFTINLLDKIPQVGNGPLGRSLYLDSSDNIIIELVNMALDEVLEIQITSSGTIYGAG